jgi:hypothetical protein
MLAQVLDFGGGMLVVDLSALFARGRPGQDFSGRCSYQLLPDASHSPEFGRGPDSSSKEPSVFEMRAILLFIIYKWSALV